MCLRTTNVRPTNRWNWDGDLIVREAIVKAGRANPATGGRYDVDIREFLTASHNAIIHRELDVVAARLPAARRALFRSRRARSFDLRAEAICAYLADEIRYVPRGRGPDSWLFPDETLDAKHGDCEDLAFLLASMLIASGVSGYCVRVALGSIAARDRDDTHHHAWVMYKAESGRWLLLDPLLYTNTATESVAARAAAREPLFIPDRYEYQPRFVFNDSHLWSVRPPDGTTLADYAAQRGDFWTDFDPSFAASVHNRIFDVALAAMPWPSRALVKAVSLAADGDFLGYHPFDHFDNAYIGSGWRRVRNRLATGSLYDFALAAHAVGDFYAHSSFGHFAIDRVSGLLAPLDERTAGDAPALGKTPVYDRGALSVTNGWFTTNASACAAQPSDVAALWQGRWISGRYAQAGDDEQGTIEKLTPFPDNLEAKPDYLDRVCLPHHDEIAVDKEIGPGEPVPDGHKLYAKTPNEYRRQFGARMNAAIEHVRAMHGRWSA